jgi:hypothetical protein
LFSRFASRYSDFSNASNHFGVFCKQTSILLSHFSTSRIYDNNRCVAKAIADLPEFSQADQYGKFLK